MLCARAPRRSTSGVRLVLPHEAYRVRVVRGIVRGWCEASCEGGARHRARVVRGTATQPRCAPEMQFATKCSGVLVGTNYQVLWGARGYQLPSALGCSWVPTTKCSGVPVGTNYQVLWGARGSRLPEPIGGGVARQAMHAPPPPRRRTSRTPKVKSRGGGVPGDATHGYTAVGARAAGA